MVIQKCKVWLIPSGLQLFTPACIDPPELMKTGKRRGGRGGGGTSNRIALTYRPIRPLLISFYSRSFILIKIIAVRSFSVKPSEETSQLTPPVIGSIVRESRRRGGAELKTQKHTPRLFQIKSGLTVRGRWGRRSPFLRTQQSGRWWTCVGYCLSICPLASIPRSAPTSTDAAKPHPFPVRPVPSDSFMASQVPRNRKIHVFFHLFRISTAFMDLLFEIQG